MSRTVTVQLTEAQIINLRTACHTSSMRGVGVEQAKALDAIAALLWVALETDKITPPTAASR